VAEVGIALLGAGGHQFTQSEVASCGASVLFESSVAPDSSEAAIELAQGAARRSGVNLASIMFSPIATRVAAAVAALELGCNVILERPAGFTTGDLEKLDDAASAGGVSYWERVTTSFDQPYRRIKQIIDTGVLGEIVLISFHRSYPWADWRSEDEAETGGLVLQSASYGLDIVCNLTQRSVSQARISETTLGEPKQKLLRMAAVLLAELDDGSVASISVDYLNPSSNPWAREEIRLLGTSGRLEFESTSGNLTLIDQKATKTESIEKGESQFLAEVVAAVREGRNTNPAAEALLQPTRVLLGMRSKAHGGWNTYAKEGWPK